MAPLAKIVFDELRDRASEMVLADRNQSIETLLVDGSHEAFGVRVGIRRLTGRLHPRIPTRTSAVTDIPCGWTCSTPASTIARAIAPSFMHGAPYVNEHTSTFLRCSSQATPLTHL
jgi:hypothetical protein